VVSYNCAIFKPGDDDTIEGSGVTEFKSSIDGIPNVFPHLPKAPIAQSGDNSAPTMIASSIPDIPQLQARPEVPEGGLAPTDNIRRAPQSSSSDGFNDNLPLPKPVPANADVSHHISYKKYLRCPENIMQIYIFS
jgi:hypothetical protein